MAKYCMKCGAPLRPDAKFCPKCGAPVSQSETSSVQHKRLQKTDPVIKEKKPAGKGGFRKTAVLLIAAAVLFTGFVKPGFFLSGKKDPGSQTTGYTPAKKTPDPSSQQKPQETPPSLPESEYTGSSRAFENTPCEGITVRAKENAFDKDTIVNFTVLDDLPTEYMQLDAELERQGLYPVYAWEVDAGLADDEVIPGEFEVEIDLDTLGIDPAFYPCLSVGRAGEDGSFYEYAVKIDGNRLTYASRQNSAAMLMIGGAVVVLTGGKAIDYYNESKYFYSKKDYFKRNVEVKTYDSGYGTYEMQWMTKDIDPQVGDKIDRIHEIEDACRAEAEEYRKTLQYTKRLDQNKEVTSYYKYLLETSEEYKQLKQEVKVPAVIDETREKINIAYKYLSEVAHVRMPKGKVIFLARTDGNTNENRDKLGLAEKLNYSTIVSLWPNKGLKDTESADNYLLTITHELFHVCQENYRFSPPIINKLTDDPRFDEMVTMVLERDAKQYYQLHDIITTDPGLTDKLRWDMMRLPADSEPKSEGTADGNDVKMREGYQLGDFVMYLQEQYRERFVSPQMLMKARSYVKKPTVSDPIRYAFGITEAEYDLYFRKWLISRQGELMQRAVGNFNEAAYFPKEYIKVGRGETRHVSLDKDDSYFLSLRGFKKNYKGSVSGILIFDDDFRRNHPSCNLMPMQSYKSLSRGAYFDDISFMIIAEIYGKLEPDENMNVGYTLYTFDKTPSPTLQEGEDVLIIQLPKTAGAAKAGVIDGYVLRIKSGDKLLSETEIPKESFEQSVNYATAGLLKDLDTSKQIELSATLCEYVKDTNGTLCPGIESDPAVIRIGKKTDEKVYSNLYLYKDQISRFDGDTIDEYSEKENFTIGAWPKNNEVRISGNTVTVSLSAVDWSISGYDKDDPKIKSGMQVLRDPIVLTGEFAGDYGEDHLWYKVTRVSPAAVNASAIETGTERESYYSSGVTSYEYIPYRITRDTALTNPSYSESLIDVYFRNGDISSVTINLYGTYTYHTVYHSDDAERDHESRDEAAYAQRISLLR